MRSFIHRVAASLQRALAQKNQDGFTVVETLAAVAVMVVALIGLMASMSSGVTDVDAARRSTTALFLAEQRLEQIKAFAMSKNGAQGFSNVNTTSFPAEAYSTITGYGDYRRTVAVTNNPGGLADTKQIQVTVFYRPVNVKGLNTETAVIVSTLIVSR
jgi:Tfp pilus assembly protein PilV